jgi:hypothetical protein
MFKWAGRIQSLTVIIAGEVLLHYNSLIISLEIYKPINLRNRCTYRSGVRNLRSVGLNNMFINLFYDASPYVQVIELQRKVNVQNYVGSKRISSHNLFTIPVYARGD